MNFFWAIVLVCLTQGAFSQYVTDGQCPSVKIQPDFNNAIVDGFWYMPQTFPWAGGAGLDCLYASYKNILQNVSAAVGGVQTSDQKQVLNIYNVRTVGSGNFLFPAKDGDINVYCISSDNKNYMTYYGCRNNGEQKTEYAWILTRERNPPKSIIDAGIKGLEDNNVDSSPLIVVNQENCPAAVAQP